MTASGVRSALVLAVATWLAVVPHLSAQNRPIVAAASDLRFALEAIAEQFRAESGERVELVFGSSGNLARQMTDGAPFELFLSADEMYVETLARSGLTRDQGVLYSVGRLVVFAPHGSPLEADGHLEGLRSLLAGGGVTRFAIANPAHAPYGKAAEAVLKAKGLWEALKPALVLGENVVQASQFASTGNAVGGLLAYSLVLAPSMRGHGTYALVPETLHAPLRQRMVLLKRASATAERFYQYLQQPAARTMLRRFGFTVPVS